jgi:hypothetical protein
MKLVNKMEIGIVTANTRTSRAEIVSIMIREPTTVIALVHTCSRSLEREVLIVSISYEIILMISPV